MLHKKVRRQILMMIVIIVTMMVMLLLLLIVMLLLLLMVMLETNSSVTCGTDEIPCDMILPCQTSLSQSGTPGLCWRLWPEEHQE